MKNLIYLIPLLLLSTKSLSQVPSINERNFSTFRFIEKDSSKTDLKNKLINNYTNHYDKLIRANDSLIDLFEQKNEKNIGNEEEMKKTEKEINKLKNEKEKIIKQKEIKLASFNGTYKWFLPSKNSLYRSQFFENTYNNNSDKTNYVNSFSISGNDNGAVAQSELVTDYIKWFRVSFGTLVSSANSSSSSTDTTTNKADASTTDTTGATQNEAFKRLINGGGNFYLEFVLPLLTTYDGKSTDLFTSYTYANIKGATDIKGFGNTIDNTTGNGSIGLNTYLGLSSESKKFNFFLQGMANYTIGSNDFYKNLGLTNEKGFINGKIIAGVTLLNTFKISGIINAFGSDESVRSGKIIFGIQFLPDLNK